MASFWDRHRQKSKWAALLLLLRWRKGLAPLMLLVVLITGMFSAPSNMVAGLVTALSGTGWGARPAAGLTRFATRVGLSGFDNSDHSFSALMAALRTAKDSRNAGIGTFLQARAEAPRMDSIGMVRGDLKEMTVVAGSLWCSADGSIGSRFKVSLDDIGETCAVGGAAGNGVKRARFAWADKHHSGVVDCETTLPMQCSSSGADGVQVNGIMSPKESRETGSAVALDPEDLTGVRASMVASAYGEDAAGKVTGAKSAAGLSGASGLSDAAGAFAGKGFFSAKGHAVNPDDLRSTLSDPTVPIAGQTNTATRRPIGWSPPANTNNSVASTERNYKMRCSSNKSCALQQMVAARNAGLMSSNPICTAGNRCPGEYAATNTGVVYDHTDIHGLVNGGSYTGSSPPILSAPPQIDGFSSPAVPDPNISLSEGTDDAPDPLQMQACMQAVADCALMKTDQRSNMEKDLQPKLDWWAAQLPKLCGEPPNPPVDCCKAGACQPCNDAETQIKILCDNAKPLMTDIEAACSPIAALPDGSTVDCSKKFGDKIPTLDPNCNDPTGKLCFKQPSSALPPICEGELLACDIKNGTFCPLPALGCLWQPGMTQDTDTVCAEFCAQRKVCCSGQISTCTVPVPQPANYNQACNPLIAAPAGCKCN
ncbi:MAG: hypothetical protein HY077_03325 [Elusimicrobia bacterium]|nr:hypothetical protein [Elusimicrobiota bacterium]